MRRRSYRCFHTATLSFMVMAYACSLVVAQSDQATQTKAAVQLLKNSKTTVFLGDSITASGQYIGFFEAWIASQKWDPAPKIINMGLSSETVSGLSEEGHAGGKFPRPDLAERLDRVLATSKPDLVFACYGMNCGIYEPLDEARLARYQQGYRQLKQKTEAAGARLVVITPPFYDDLRRPLTGFSYNDVLEKYSQWLLSQREQGWLVIDLHSAMTREVLQKRKTDPSYTVQPDGVHPDAAGHWIVARALIQGLGADLAEDASVETFLATTGQTAESMTMVQQRVALLRDAYVSAAGHKRPGVAAGLPIADAEKKAAEITAKLLRK